MRKYHKLYAKLDTPAGNPGKAPRKRKPTLSDNTYPWKKDRDISIRIFEKKLTPSVSSKMGRKTAFFYQILDEKGDVIGATKKEPDVGPFDKEAVAKQVAEAVANLYDGVNESLSANPSHRLKLASNARRKLARANPSVLENLAGAVGYSAIGQDAIGGAELSEEMQGIGAAFGLPRDNRLAAELGFQWGVLRGFEMCGITNVLERARFRREYNQKIQSSVDALAKSVISGGPAAAEPGSARRR